MTKRSLSSKVRVVAIIYAISIAALLGARWRAPFAVYDTLKDSIPLIIAIPAAYLAYGFQRRSSFVSYLRVLWKDVVEAVQTAVQYTYSGSIVIDSEYGKPIPSQEEFGIVLNRLSVVIDQMRGAYANLHEHLDGGFYPFESLKQIYDEIVQVGYGSAFSQERATKARAIVLDKWRNTRAIMTAEFEREEPTEYDVPYVGK